MALLDWIEIHDDPWDSFIDTEMKLYVPLGALSGKGAKCAWRSRLRMQLRMLQTRSWTLCTALDET